MGRARRAAKSRIDTNWASDLNVALAGGNAREMKAALARVPRNVLHTAVPYIAELAKGFVREKRSDEALTCLDKLIEIEPDHIEGHRLSAQAHEELRQWSKARAAHQQVLRLDSSDEHARSRLEAIDVEMRKQEMLRRTLDPQSAEAVSAVEPTPLPQVAFEPAAMDPAIPASVSPAMVDGLRQHLRRYGDHQAVRSALDRLEDPSWLEAWDRWLATTADRKVFFAGSELGTFAVRALNHGASRVLVQEPHPLATRVASGIIQKNLLLAWHAKHGDAVQEWSQEQRKESFESFAQIVDIGGPESAAAPDPTCDWLVFPAIDHTLLGTGLAVIARAWRERGLLQNARMVPGSARVFAMGIEWLGPGAGFDLQALEAFRWSLHPQPLELPDNAWRALTRPMELGTIDLASFEPTTWRGELPISQSGRLGALLFWFELDLGGVVLSSAPGNGQRHLRPAVQYVDAKELQEGETLRIEAQVSDTRIGLRCLPPSVETRTHLLPSWYMPMLLDAERNGAYRQALAAAMDERPMKSALDIGAGCALLSMMAAEAGADQVVGCEVVPELNRAAGIIVARNGFGDRVKIVNKDCRQLQVPLDLPARADLAVFELFDCSLIGEGVLHFLAHAREHLLEENARYVPMSATIRGMLIEHRLERIWDVDVNLLNPYRFSPSFINVDSRDMAWRPLSEAFDLFSFDFATATPAPAQTQIAVPATGEGTVGAMLFWFDLQMSADRRISNAPGTALHWKQGLQFLPEMQVTRELSLRLTSKHDGSSLSFAWDVEAMPGERFSRLPRFDPRWLHQATELQTQTAELFRHCGANPAEYAGVAELAKRFALDPAAHGIDPRIAQRFAGKFFGL